MILVINKKWLRRQTSQAFQEDIFHPRIYRNIFSEQYWECSGNKKGSRKSSASLSIYERSRKLFEARISALFYFLIFSFPPNSEIFFNFFQIDY